MLLKLSLLVLSFLVDYSIGSCGRCQPNFVACHNESTFSLCIDGSPSQSHHRCPVDTVCTDEPSICVSKFDRSVRPTCLTGCGVCSSYRQVFACISPNTFAFCFGEVDLFPTMTGSCLDGYVCDLSSRTICVKDTDSKPSCEEDYIIVTTTPNPSPGDGDSSTTREGSTTTTQNPPEPNPPDSESSTVTQDPPSSDSSSTTLNPPDTDPPGGVTQADPSGSSTTLDPPGTDPLSTESSSTTEATTTITAAADTSSSTNEDPSTTSSSSSGSSSTTLDPSEIIDPTASSTMETTTRAPRDVATFCAETAASGIYKAEGDSTCTKYYYCTQDNGVYSGTEETCVKSGFFNSETRTCQQNRPVDC